MTSMHLITDNHLYFSLDAFGQYWESDGKTTFQMRQSPHDVKSPCHWLNLYGSEDLAGLDMFCVTIRGVAMGGYIPTPQISLP